MSTQHTELILIVDDTPANLDVISEALSDAGFEVAIATSGERALQQVEYELPALILLDVMMPGIDGFETCKRLKENPKTRNIPIIFMTALSDVENKVRALELGAVDYVTKPFQEHEVLARVKTHIQLYSLTQNLERQVAKKSADLQASQLQLVRSEKMSALGNLVAGVAHEINNPVGFLFSNLQPAQEYVQDLFGLINLYQQKYPNPDPEIVEQIEAVDLEFLQKDLPQLLNSMKLGLERIRNISTSLRTFSRSDTDSQVLFDIRDGLESTILILKYRLRANETRPAIEVMTEYGDIPEISCFPGQLNQVFMNILANAIDMFDEVAQQSTFTELQAKPQIITVQMRLATPKVVEIRIRDNGTGMSEEVQARIFDHLFTTKSVGKGTGLGLAISRQIIEENHGGTISANSVLGEGTEFMIQLPCIS
ncbi:MAG: hybrid sensor histidine kinase/response regulator [Leptolyngbya sp. UWPOB_LEPTO1]|uniref:sensor histidine kinase n=1 Tax=Leptolyngbya sp. UWPOB_LEPTO1 TaxID=2815653 RepID=UPI001ACB7B68|nr:response regulator [Leptolyngbya sp. UWPOB_LEPTO1]MBN8565058.1 hybrid sensor histidine kinase/response regulator [Leptolyngbya sp. UWPOB_LEPTO1]